MLGFQLQKCSENRRFLGDSVAFGRIRKSAGPRPAPRPGGRFGTDSVGSERRDFGGVEGRRNNLSKKPIAFGGQRYARGTFG